MRILSVRKRERPDSLPKNVPEMELNGRELQTGMNVIRAMFPSTSEDVMKKALEAAEGDTETAINYIMDGSYNSKWAGRVTFNIFIVFALFRPKN